MPHRLVLASASPRRRELLATLGLPFTVVGSGVAETSDPRHAPVDQVMLIAAAKTRAVASQYVDAFVIGADTAIVLETQLLGKPGDAADAMAMLRALRGRSHRVLTGIAVRDAASGREEHRVVETIVEMLPVGDAEIARYVATGEPLDKAGGYGIQGRGGTLVAGFRGCYTNVVGLPLCDVTTLLDHFGLVPLAPPPWCTLPDGRPCPRLPPDQTKR